MEHNKKGRVDGAATSEKTCHSKDSTGRGRTQRRNLSAGAFHTELESIRSGLLDLGMELEDVASALSLHQAVGSRELAMDRLQSGVDLLDVLVYRLQMLPDAPEVSR